MKKYGYLVFALALCYLVEWSGSAFTNTSVGTWYLTLNRPSWNPPAILFPIVWSILYTMIAYSHWCVFLSRKKHKGMAYCAFAVQLFLNFSWSWSFFYMQSPGLGLSNVVLLVLAIIWNFIAFYRVSKVGAWLLVPYFIWVVYATALNFWIWMMN
ncbi:MAG: Tryptophan-rich protein TspO [Chlamydiia bacterium]|nr:Tryptophan-rich protein TspO [Chlamydiia bacterium]MCH9615450.1 Tryptophan-rich protein TspO [Chlamydiia bacterium]MCH9629105.1 Tryptophan-rich protein TspO [Chlamydiia bacterium]